VCVLCVASTSKLFPSATATALNIAKPPPTVFLLLWRPRDRSNIGALRARRLASDLSPVQQPRPAFTLGNSPQTELALKEPPGTTRIAAEPLNRIACSFLAPSGKNPYFGLPGVNPKLGCLAPSVCAQAEEVKCPALLTSQSSEEPKSFDLFVKLGIGNRDRSHAR
jgi:hypothetical protein